MGTMVTGAAKITSADKRQESKSRSGPGIGHQVLIALLLGVSAGLFFGELTTKIKFIGDIYVSLLQMMVLPYIIISLVGGIGKLTLEQARQLVKYAFLVLLLMWLLIGGVLILLTLALPELTSASFYSSSLVEPAKQIGFIEIFIPKNIFASLSNGQIPAIVVFCIALGIALITAQEKHEVFKLLDVLADAVMRVIKFMVKLTPIGVFAMTAVAAGNMGFEELGRLQGYFILYTVAVLVLGFWLLPGLIASLTPFKYRDVISIAWPAMVLAFAASKVLIALPLIIEGIKRLFEKHQIGDQNDVAVAEMLVPIAYPFPNTGKLLSLLFVPFAAWFIGSPLSLGDYPGLLAGGFLSYFGNVAVAMPFLLDLARLPSDLFDLFVLTGILCARLSDALGAMDLFAFSVLVTCASAGMMRVRWHWVVVTLASGLLAFLISIVGVRAYLGYVSEGAYDKDKVLASMQLLEDVVESIIVDPEPNPLPLQAEQSRLDRIRERGVIRIGYHPERLPFSYTNISGKLVGFDVDMAQRLARELHVAIEFVPFSFDTLSEQLAEDHFDIAMSGVYGTVEQSGNVRLSDPYLFATMALVVSDHRDTEFATPVAIRKQDRVGVGVHRSLAGDEILSSTLRDYPNAELVVLDSYRDFFEQRDAGRGIDALYTGAESGSAWTLLYPEYQVVTPWSDSYTIPFVYPYSADEDNEMDEFLDHWVMLKQHDGTTKKAYEHWILGSGGEQKAPRWSVIRDVLGWVD